MHRLAEIATRPSMTLRAGDSISVPMPPLVLVSTPPGPASFLRLAIMPRNRPPYSRSRATTSGNAALTEILSGVEP